MALVLLVAALALPAYARSKTRESLQTSKDISGDFLDVQTTLFPLRYTVTHLKVRRTDAILKDPFFYADRLAVDLRWGPLLGGRLVGDVAAEGVKVVIEQPQAGGAIRRLPSIEEIIPVRRWWNACSSRAPRSSTPGCGSPTGRRCGSTTSRPRWRTFPPGPA